MSDKRTGQDIAKELNQIVFSYGVLSLQEKELQEKIDVLEDRFFQLKQEHVDVSAKEQAFVKEDAPIHKDADAGIPTASPISPVGTSLGTTPTDKP